MSTRKAAILVSLVSLLGAPGCWEQMSAEWWPQMKWQPAVQAFEEVKHDDQLQGFMPPEGTVPIAWAGVAEPAGMPVVDQEVIPNPVPATFSSLTNGKAMFERYCAACHGMTGAGDGPVAAPGPLNPTATGPLAGVLPLTGPVGSALTGNLSDGHIYTTISIGRGKMPNYNRIPPKTRWDIVNYIRELNSPGGAQ